jgi:YebC/PmpR family DNA-binding regulatory protein
MSGPSKWSTIKHKKGALDAKRGSLFTRCIKEITVAARSGGGDPDGNPRLRAAIAAAKAVNMPSDNIKRAIQRGTGELPGVTYEEVTYEGYGPGGVAVLAQCQTDNRHRTASEIRHLFAKHGGNLGESNCVAYMFDRKGQFVVAREAVEEDRLLELVLESGGDDVVVESDSYEILTSPEAHEGVRKALEDAKIPVTSAEIAMIPQNTVHLAGAKAKQCVTMMEALEEHEDVQKVSANFDIDDSELE